VPENHNLVGSLACLDTILLNRRGRVSDHAEFSKALLKRRGLKEKMNLPYVLGSGTPEHRDKEYNPPIDVHLDLFLLSETGWWGQFCGILTCQSIANFSSGQITTPPLYLRQDILMYY
jgi:hypothetical protein